MTFSERREDPASIKVSFMDHTVDGEMTGRSLYNRRGQQRDGQYIWLTLDVNSGSFPDSLPNEISRNTPSLRQAYSKVGKRLAFHSIGMTGTFDSTIYEHPNGERLMMDVILVAMYYDPRITFGASLSEVLAIGKAMAVEIEQASSIDAWRKQHQNHLGHKAFQNGDYANAFRRFHSNAISTDDEIAFYRMGWMAEAGKGTPPSDEEAARWYRKADDLGFAPAQTSLARLYIHGRGVSKDPEKAVTWYTRAAKQEEIAASETLCLFYSIGITVKQDYAQAFRWCLKAAKLGNRVAQHNLALFYKKGLGVKRNMNMSNRWSALAIGKN